MLAASLKARENIRKFFRMVQVVSILLYKWDPNNAIEVSGHHNLSKIDFFKRGTVKSFIKFHARTVVTRTLKGQRQTIQFEENMGKCHVYVSESGLAAAVLTDGDYPMRVAFTLLNETMRVFEDKSKGGWRGAKEDVDMDFREGDELLKKFQNPSEADKISKIEKELEEVKGIVVKSMDDILKRGETLDSLVQKSNDLSEMSRQFYRTAKKNNQCCQMY